MNELQGNFLGQEFSFRSSQACHCWYGFAGVSLATKPGTYTLRVEGKGAGGKETAMSYLVRVSAAHYPTSTIKVAPAFVEPPKETEPVIAAADAAKKQAFATTDPIRLWSGRFEPPTETEDSGVFGSARVLQRREKEPAPGPGFPRQHWYAGRTRTKAGTVILARPLYFEGNCIMMDHGQGLLTIYMHLSEFKVKEGEKVTAGQLIALSGGTGRSTGPHLHFAVRWRGEYLDPRTLLELHPPGS